MVIGELGFTRCITAILWQDASERSLKCRTLSYEQFRFSSDYSYFSISLLALHRLGGGRGGGET